jgi:hypothetical protein
MQSRQALIPELLVPKAVSSTESLCRAIPLSEKAPLPDCSLTRHSEAEVRTPQLYIEQCETATDVLREGALNRAHR